jgi:hypothetical protein
MFGLAVLPERKNCDVKRKDPVNTCQRLAPTPRLFSCSGSLHQIKKNLQDGNGNHGNNPSHSATAPTAKLRDSHKLEDDQSEPKDGLDAVQDQVGLQALPLGEPLRVFGEQLVCDEHECFDGLHIKVVLVHPAVLYRT